MPSFAALLLVALIGNALRWVIMGGLETTKKPLENDGIDIENVLISLYGQGFRSVDKNAVGMYEDMKALIPRIWPQYV